MGNKQQLLPADCLVCIAQYGIELSDLGSVILTSKDFYNSIVLHSQSFWKFYFQKFLHA